MGNEFMNTLLGKVRHRGDNTFLGMVRHLGDEPMNMLLGKMKCIGY